MPVTGLPAAVETTLSALLTDNAVSSWKVAGEGQNTVVVLRLQPLSQMSTTMAAPVLNRRTQIQYRKKPPSQRRRDEERALQQQQRRLQQVGASDSHVRTDESPTQNIQPFASADNTTHYTGEEHTTAAHANQIISENEDTQVLEDQYSLQPPSASDCNISLHLQECDPRTENCVAENYADGVRDYVSTITDQSVHRRLRDSERNLLFRRVALHQSDDQDEVLLCESDDVVVEFSCDACREDQCVFWYIKQEGRNMLEVERDKLANLRKGKRLCSTSYTETQARALHRLHTLRTLIQFYLG